MVVTRFLLDLREMHSRAIASATIIETGASLSEFHAATQQGGTTSILEEFGDPEAKGVGKFLGGMKSKDEEDEEVLEIN